MIYLFDKKKNLINRLVIGMLLCIFPNIILYVILHFGQILEKILLTISIGFLDILCVFYILFMLKRLLQKSAFITFYDQKIVFKTIFLPFSLNYMDIKQIQFYQKKNVIVFKINKDMRVKNFWPHFYYIFPKAVDLRNSTSIEIDNIFKIFSKTNIEIIYK